mmetsp:Transcript_102376/g.161586  ORF Transcript_102376/g.161586 Transcript_102376/m.161586 type:complete len:573 (-) Transcript_102376:321-2039(-)
MDLLCYQHVESFRIPLAAFLIVCLLVFYIADKLYFRKLVNRLDDDMLQYREKCTAIVNTSVAYSFECVVEIDAAKLTMKDVSGLWSVFGDVGKTDLIGVPLFCFISNPADARSLSDSVKKLISGVQGQRLSYPVVGDKLRLPLHRMDGTEILVEMLLVLISSSSSAEVNEVTSLSVGIRRSFEIVGANQNQCSVEGSCAASAVSAQESSVEDPKPAHTQQTQQQQQQPSQQPQREQLESPAKSAEHLQPHKNTKTTAGVPERRSRVDFCPQPSARHNKLVAPQKIESALAYVKNLRSQPSHGKGSYGQSGQRPTPMSRSNFHVHAEQDTFQQVKRVERAIPELKSVERYSPDCDRPSWTHAERRKEHTGLELKSVERFTPESDGSRPHATNGMDQQKDATICNLPMPFASELLPQPEISMLQAGLHRGKMSQESQRRHLPPRPQARAEGDNTEVRRISMFAALQQTLTQEKRTAVSQQGSIYSCATGPQFEWQRASSFAQSNEIQDLGMSQGIAQMQNMNISSSEELVALLHKISTHSCVEKKSAERKSEVSLGSDQGQRTEVSFVATVTDF